jgi:hypothetical protein
MRRTLNGVLPTIGMTARYLNATQVGVRGAFNVSEKLEAKR